MGTLSRFFIRSSGKIHRTELLSLPMKGVVHALSLPGCVECPDAVQ